MKVKDMRAVSRAEGEEEKVLTKKINLYHWPCTVFYLNEGWAIWEQESRAAGKDEKMLNIEKNNLEKWPCTGFVLQ